LLWGLFSARIFRLLNFGLSMNRIALINIAQWWRFL